MSFKEYVKENTDSVSLDKFVAKYFPKLEKDSKYSSKFNTNKYDDKDSSLKLSIKDGILVAEIVGGSKHQQVIKKMEDATHLLKNLNDHKIASFAQLINKYLV